MFVIDPPLRFSHSGSVLTDVEIRLELIRQLDAGTVKAVAVAKHLGISKPRVSEMRKLTRRVQQHEMQPLAELLQMEGARESFPLVSEGELAEMLAEVQAQMPALLPAAEWPRYVAEALRMRLDMLSRDRSKAGIGALQA